MPKTRIKERNLYKLQVSVSPSRAPNEYTTDSLFGIGKLLGGCFPDDEVSLFKDQSRLFRGAAADCRVYIGFVGTQYGKDEKSLAEEIVNRIEGSDYLRLAEISGRWKRLEAIQKREGKFCIDFHGLGENAAIELMSIVDECAKEKGFRGQLLYIVGRGLHSKGDAILSPLVQKSNEKRIIDHDEHDPSGWFTVEYDFKYLLDRKSESSTKKTGQTRKKEPTIVVVSHRSGRVHPQKKTN